MEFSDSEVGKKDRLSGQKDSPDHCAMAKVKQKLFFRTENVSGGRTDGESVSFVQGGSTKKVKCTLLSLLTSDTLMLIKKEVYCH